MNSSYLPPSKSHWHGRHSAKKEYWHQVIQFVDLFKAQQVHADIAFLGYQCEEGVRRNQGRPGTKEGPNAIREMLGKLPIHRDDVQLADCGNLVYNEAIELSTFQLQFAGHIARLLKDRTFPIALGGGHDISYAHFCGIHDALYQDGSTFGIVNFDAHFDLREENQATSGTPFKQLLDQYGDHTHYLALGIQQSANPKSLFEAASRTGSQYLLLENCSTENYQLTLDAINLLLEKVDHLYITVDMDGFSSSFSPGVSAPSAFGLTPQYVQQTLRYLMQTKKVVAIDFAELNPGYDLDCASVRLAAKLIWEVIQYVD